MKTRLLSLLLFAGSLCFTTATAETRLGGGVNYWTSVKDLDFDDLDKNGFAYFVSWQKRSDLLGFDLTLERMPDRFDSSAWAPQGYVILGRRLYAAAGAGITYADSSFADEPFFALKAGLDLQVIPGLAVDISANYRFNDRAELRDRDTKISTDTVFLGAAVRLVF